MGSIVFLTLFNGGVGDQPISSKNQPLGNISLSHFFGISQQELFSLITATTVAIFAFSAVASSIVKDIEVGRRLMVGGFVYLFFMIFLIPLYNFYTNRTYYLARLMIQHT